MTDEVTRLTRALERMTTDRDVEKARADVFEQQLSKLKPDLARTKAALITEIGLHQKVRLLHAAQLDRKMEGARALTRAHWRYSRSRAACGAVLTLETNMAPSREFFFFTSPDARCPQCEQAAQRIALPLFQAVFATLDREDDDGQ